jgi:4-hydroxythreonine-4-phosphate dehydrogenase
MSLPRVAVTLGDPRGIGPEVVARALGELVDAAEWITIGPTGTEVVPVVSVGAWDVSGDAVRAGALAGAAIEAAVGMAMRGEVDAIVTAPIDKHALAWLATTTRGTLRCWRASRGRRPR